MATQAESAPTNLLDEIKPPNLHSSTASYSDRDMDSTEPAHDQMSRANGHGNDTCNNKSKVVPGIQEELDEFRSTESHEVNPLVRVANGRGGSSEEEEQGSGSECGLVGGKRVRENGELVQTCSSGSGSSVWSEDGSNEQGSTQYGLLDSDPESGLSSPGDFPVTGDAPSLTDNLNHTVAPTATDDLVPSAVGGPIELEEVAAGLYTVDIPPLPSFALDPDPVPSLPIDLAELSSYTGLFQPLDTDSSGIADHISGTNESPNTDSGGITDHISATPGTNESPNTDSGGTTDHISTTPGTNESPSTDSGGITDHISTTPATDVSSITDTIPPLESNSDSTTLPNSTAAETDASSYTAMLPPVDQDPSSTTEVSTPSLAQESAPAIIGLLTSHDPDKREVGEVNDVLKGGVTEDGDLGGCEGVRGAEGVNGELCEDREEGESVGSEVCETGENGDETGVRGESGEGVEGLGEGVRGESGEDVEGVGEGVRGESGEGDEGVGEGVRGESGEDVEGVGEGVRGESGEGDEGVGEGVRGESGEGVEGLGEGVRGEHGEGDRRTVKGGIGETGEDVTEVHTTSEHQLEPVSTSPSPHTIPLITTQSSHPSPPQAHPHNLRQRASSTIDSDHPLLESNLDSSNLDSGVRPPRHPGTDLPVLQPLSPDPDLNEQYEYLRRTLSHSRRRYSTRRRRPQRRGRGEGVQRSESSVGPSGREMRDMLHTQDNRRGEFISSMNTCTVNLCVSILYVSLH